jgi:hypothetical protein
LNDKNQVCIAFVPEYVHDFKTSLVDVNIMN